MIDVQNGVVTGGHQRDAVVGNVASLVDRARLEQVPVVWVQHSDEGLPRSTPEWEIVPELAPRDGEAVVHKNYGDSFEATDLEERLAEHGVGRLVVTGAQTDACIRSTLHGALVRGYDTTLVSDGHTTEDMRRFGMPIGPEEAIAYTNTYWAYTAAPGRAGTVTSAAEVDFSTT